MTPLAIQPERILTELSELARISAHPAPAVTRVLFSPEDLQARSWLLEKAKACGLKTRIDPVGNLFITLQGTDPTLPAIATGSHIDAIPNAGAYDGTVGVLGGLEALRAMREAGYHPRRSIELIMFTAEEPTRFGIGCLGSRLLAGTTSANEAKQLIDGEGNTLESLRPASCQGPLEAVKLSSGHYEAFIELHIEQGPLLEQDSLDIGLVESIAAPAAFRLRFLGAGGHAGSVLMQDRRDAFLAAAETALVVERAALTSGSPDTVGTTGVAHLHPGAINSIPCDVTLEIDFRDTQLQTRESAIARIHQEALAICARRQIALEWSVIHADPPALCSTALLEIAQSQANHLGYTTRRMISRAYHDSLFMALLCPTLMLFIPCRNGWSHRPDEYASPQSITRGVQLLTETLRDLAG